MVDLPLPVIPVTRIRPKWRPASFSIAARGMFRSSNEGIFSGRNRMVQWGTPALKKAETRA